MSFSFSASIFAPISASGFPSRSSATRPTAVTFQPGRINDRLHLLVEGFQPAPVQRPVVVVLQVRVEDGDDAADLLGSPVVLPRQPREALAATPLGVDLVIADRQGGITGTGHTPPER